MVDPLLTGREKLKNVKAEREAEVMRHERKIRMIYMSVDYAPPFPEIARIHILCHTSLFLPYLPSQHHPSSIAHHLRQPQQTTIHHMNHERIPFNFSRPRNITDTSTASACLPTCLLPL
jgi:hypothetical protein